MSPKELPPVKSTPELSRSGDIPATPELGDVVDSLEEAATMLGHIFRGEAQSMADDARCLIRENPVTAVAAVGAVAYLIGRIMR